MTSRVAATLFGVIAGVAAGLFLILKGGAAIASLHVVPPDLAAAVTAPFARAAWTFAIALAVFTTVATVVALVGGLVQALRVRARIDRLRHDLRLADRWNAADWRAAFQGSAVADRAEAIVIAGSSTSDGDRGSTRTLLTDTTLLLNLEEIWLDRLTLARTLVPLPGLLLAFAVALALLGYISGAGWEIPVAAGVMGGLYIVLARYLLRLLLGPAVELAVRAATAAVRPLLPIGAAAAAPAPVRQPDQALAVQPQAGTIDSAAIAMALSEALAGPLARIAEAANRLADFSQPQGELVQITEDGREREQAIESALAEIRAGIERLLESSAQSTSAGDAARRTDRHNALINDIARSVEGLSAQSADVPAADALKNLLREFDEG